MNLRRARFRARPRLLRALLIMLPGLAAGTAQVRAQVPIELQGRGDYEHDALLRATLAGDALLLSEDTLIAAGDTIRRTVLVAGATVRLNGAIAGDLVIVDGNVFVRPTGSIAGAVSNLGGGFYPSEQAAIAGPVTDDPNAPYEVVYLEDRVRIVGTRRRSALVLDGFRGVRIPSYDRVNGLTVGAGAGWLPPALGRIEPLVRGWVEYRFARGSFGGGAELSLERGDDGVLVGAERTSATEDAWRRGPLTNSASTIWSGKDYRNYYERDRYYGELYFTDAREGRTLRPFLRGQVEDAASLSTRDVFTVLGDDTLRVNPAIDAATITSAIAGASLLVERPLLQAEVTLETEAGFSDDVADFYRFVLDGESAFPGLADHTVELDLHLRGPIGGGTLPRQRWSFAGGSNVLYTEEIGALRGDRLAFAGMRYVIPFPERFTLRIIGRPRLVLLQHAATAWTETTDPDLTLNFGAEIRWPFFYGRVVVDPDRFDEPKLSVNVSLPDPTRAWERNPRR